MSLYPEPIHTLILNLAKLPGIGRKTAERLTLHILHAPESEARQLASAIVDIREKVRLCRVCSALTDQDECRICRSPSRDASVICVVENPTDMAALEKSGAYTGRYHILGGVLSPMDGIGPDHIRIRELLERIRSGGIREVIIATGTDVEGEATASYIAEILGRQEVKVTRIASGVPMGGDLQYVDQVTLQRAMEGRRDV